MPSVDPSPLTYTLRLKHHKTTVLIHADPLQPLSALKQELLTALTDTHPDGHLNGQPLPTSATKLTLGKQTDPSDPQLGWASLEAGVDSEGEDDGEAGRRGKNRKGGRKGEESLKGVGIKDNAVLAFKWGDGGGKGKRPVGGEDEMEIEGEERWDVVLPSYEEAFGLEPSGDVSE